MKSWREIPAKASRYNDVPLLHFKVILEQFLGTNLQSVIILIMCTFNSFYIQFYIVCYIIYTIWLYSDSIARTILLNQLEFVADKDTVWALGSASPDTEPVVATVGRLVFSISDLNLLGKLRSRGMTNIQVFDETLAIK